MSKKRSDKTAFSYPWYESLQVKIGAFFLLLFLFTALCIFMILKNFGDKIIEDEAYLRLNQANNKVISELARHTVLSATLAQAMANISEKLPNDQHLYHTLLPKLIDHKGAQAYIAGGGVWPAPYQFSPSIEKHSFFWARDQFKGFVFNDSYNKPGHSYHDQEWYVPATHLNDDAVYWSRSYIDPYSLEPMVTVSAPLIRNHENVGVATIDLKLHGLRELLEQITRSFDGYAFVLDRNGTFLSYPNQEAILSTETAFINYQTLAQKDPAFRPLAAILDNENSAPYTTGRQKSRLIDKLAQQLLADSTQIGAAEAQLIASSILYPIAQPYHRPTHSTNKVIAHDPLLDETAFVAISSMPETHWKIITVMPYRIGAAAISLTYLRLTQATLIALLLTVLSIWLFVKYMITSPISHLAKQIQSEADSSDLPPPLYNSAAKGELRTLVNLFNLRTKQLVNSQRNYDKLAHFDPLTALSNRQSLIKRLNDELAGNASAEDHGALLFINIDNFKRINNSLGYQMGDALLVQLAQRVSECVDSDDTVARLGGDEFVVLMMKSFTYTRKLTHEATSVAKKIIDAMQAPIILQGNPHHMTLSIGITIFAKQGGDSDSLLHQADTAMYHAKSKGKNCFCLFNEAMREDASHRLEIEEALRLAIKQKDLFLLYQPQVNERGECVSVEVLVRWMDSRKGVLSPVEFLHIAEENGLILKLGQWILEEACAQFQIWTEQSVAIANISINVSPEQFRDINFVSSVRKTISTYQLQAEQLTLEITEGIAIADIKDSISKMKQLSAIGVQLAIDDFGVGDSALRYLKDLPIKQLKIGPSFFCDIAEQASNALILKTIVDIAKHLKLDLIAKGVEDEQQYAQLLKLGCNKFQGFYFSAPKTATEIEDQLKQKR